MQGPAEDDVKHLIERARHVGAEHQAATRKARELRESCVNARLACKLDLMLERVRQPAGHDVLLDASVAAAMEFLEADFGNIQRVFHGRGLALVAQRNFSSPFLNHFAYVEDTGSACGLALQAGGLVCVNDVTRSPVFRDSEAHEQLLIAGVRSVSSVPLRRTSGEVVGMLSVHYRAPREFGAADRMRLLAVARAVGRVIRT